VTYRPLTDADRATIEAMYQDGETLAEIARAIGRPRSYAPARYLERRGLYEPRRRADMAARVGKAAELYATGRPVAVVLRRYAVSPPTLYRALRERSIPVRRPGLSAAMREVARRRWAGEEAP
jgi:hypothetical protein